jgi:SSS family solute:Na+ symporter
MNLAWLSPYGFSKMNDKGVYEIPFLDRMGFVFAFCVIGMVIISFIENPKGDRAHALEVDTSMFKTSKSFAAGALIIGGILVALYSLFW